MLEPTLIRPDSTPAEVLAAMLPVVRKAFAEPVKFGFVGHGEFEPYGYLQVGGVMPNGSAWAWKFASHVLPALMELDQSRPGQERAIARDALGWHLAAFRDAWCAAAENASKETTQPIL